MFLGYGRPSLILQRNLCSGRCVVINTVKLSAKPSNLVSSGMRSMSTILFIIFHSVGPSTEHYSTSMWSPHPPHTKACASRCNSISVDKLDISDIQWQTGRPPTYLHIHSEVRRKNPCHFRPWKAVYLSRSFPPYCPLRPTSNFADRMAGLQPAFLLFL